MTNSIESVPDFSLAWEDHPDGPHVRWRIGDYNELIRADMTLFNRDGYALLWIRGATDVLTYGRGMFPLSVSASSVSFYLIGFAVDDDTVEFNQIISDAREITQTALLRDRELTRFNEDGLPVSVFSSSRSSIGRWSSQAWRDMTPFIFDEE